jgi:hypothetical protein
MASLESCNPQIQVLCVKSAMQIVSDQQDRLGPKKNINMNANAPCDLNFSPVGYSEYRRKD